MTKGYARWLVSWLWDSVYPPDKGNKQVKVQSSFREFLDHARKRNRKLESVVMTEEERAVHEIGLHPRKTNMGHCKRGHFMQKHVHAS